MLGHGLVWNPGEWVEGFTNPLWTLLIAGGVGLGGEAPEFGYVLGLLSGLAMLVCALAVAVATLSGCQHRPALATRSLVKMSIFPIAFAR